MSRPTTSTDAELAGWPQPDAGQLGWTRFAPAPTGYLHLGHVANAIWVWGLAAATGSRVLLRIEDHDRERSRPEYDAAILEDLAWLGFVPDAGPVRQRESPAPYDAALERLRGDGLVYACDCTRSTFAAWAAEHGRPWRGPGCPGGCRDCGLSDDGELTLRVALGTGDEIWEDRCLGSRVGEPSAAGDLAIRDRHGNWTYGFAVVIDDLRQSISLVVRGEDLAEATPAQIRFGAPTWTLRAARLRAPPAHSETGRRQALQGRRRHRCPRAARGGSDRGVGHRCGRRGSWPVRQGASDHWH